MLQNKIETALFLLCSATYAVSLVCFGVVLPGTVYTMVDQRGEPTVYMEKSLFMVMYTALLLPVFLIQFYERIPSPGIIRKLCRTMNEQAPRLGAFYNPRVWKWIALAAYGFLLYIFLTICVSNCEHAGT